MLYHTVHIWRLFPTQTAVEPAVVKLGDVITLKFFLTQGSHGASYWSNNAWQDYWWELLEKIKSRHQGESFVAGKSFEGYTTRCNEQLNVTWRLLHSIYIDMKVPVTSTRSLAGNRCTSLPAGWERLATRRAFQMLWSVWSQARRTKTKTNKRFAETGVFGHPVLIIVSSQIKNKCYH